MKLYDFTVENSAGHNEGLELKVESYEITRTGFDGGQYADDNGLGLHFNWDLPISHYINIGVLKVGC